ncbi:helix-turn-helix domain-containing protein [Kitasatospora sp. NPDC004240]
MSEDTGAAETEEFARLLRELKDRSGLSYGTLAKRLHMSTSTLHRYCSGTALPHEYAPAERFARLCRATPEELVELHRSWILADAARARRAGRAAEPEPKSNPEPKLNQAPEPEPAVAQTQTQTQNQTPAPAPAPAVVVPAVEPSPPRRHRRAMIASAAAVALLAAVVTVGRWGGGNGADGRQTAGATMSTVPQPSLAAPTVPTAGTVPTTGATTTGAAPATSNPTPAATPPDGAPAPLTVGVRPYVYADPCSQHFLVNSAPAQVGPPATTERDAPRWAAAYGAVSSGEQMVALTVQGTGADTVVLEALHVRITVKGAPLAWNDYSMGVGCGGGVDSKSFEIDLDRGSPVISLKGGQRDFPYKVSKSDPEVFYVTAHTRAHDVRWDLSLDWSSGDRRGTIRVDNAGAPFRTSADVNRPGYDYPLGGGEWIKRTVG